MDLTAKISARLTNLVARRFPDVGRRSTSNQDVTGGISL